MVDHCRGITCLGAIFWHIDFIDRDFLIEHGRQVQNSKVVTILTINHIAFIGGFGANDQIVNAIMIYIAGPGNRQPGAVVLANAFHHKTLAAIAQCDV